MKKIISLKYRIIIAFTIQTLIVSIIAFSTLNLYVDYIEEALLYEHLSKYLDSYTDALAVDKSPIVTSDMKIYDELHNDIPLYANNLTSGGHEIVLDNGLAYHVIVKFYENKKFILIKDQTGFEKLEGNINSITIFVLTLFSIVSFLFSKTLANRIIQPVVDLSEKVRDINVNNFNQIKLDYPDDEIGALVKIIYGHVKTSNKYLQREKWFTGDISHELRTPMMVISSSLDLIKQNKLTDDQKAVMYQRIDGAVKNVNELIDTFLLLARGRPENNLQNEMCDLKVKAYSVIENLRSYVEDKDIQFEVVSDTGLVLPVNPALFSIVLTNLIRNSILNIDKGKISIKLQPDGFNVEDTGEGLPDIIKQFVNGKEIMSNNRNTNMGLGLSIVKRICEQEKWSIVAYNCEKGGACFKITF